MSCYIFRSISLILLMLKHPVPVQSAFSFLLQHLQIAKNTLPIGPQQTIRNRLSMFEFETINRNVGVI